MKCAGGAVNGRYPRKAKGGNQTPQNNGMRLFPQAGNWTNEDGSWGEHLASNKFNYNNSAESYLTPIRSLEKGAQVKSGTASPSLSSDSTTAPGTPPGFSTPPGISSPRSTEFQMEELMEECMWRAMEELARKTESLHATELRAQIAEQKLMGLQMQVQRDQRDRMSMENQLRGCSTTADIIAAQLAILQLQQACGMPPKIGIPQPAVNPWPSVGPNAYPPVSLEGPNAHPPVSLEQRVPLKVGPVMPQRHGVGRVGKQQKKKAASMAEPGLLSRGSKNHALNRCRPCSFFFSAGGCPQGAQCNFCHYPHSEAKIMEAAVYSVQASEKKAMQKSGAKFAQDDATGLASLPQPSAVPQPNFSFNRRTHSKGSQSTESTTPPESQAGDPIWSVTVQL